MSSPCCIQSFIRSTTKAWRKQWGVGHLSAFAAKGRLFQQSLNLRCMAAADSGFCLSCPGKSHGELGNTLSMLEPIQNLFNMV